MHFLFLPAWGTHAWSQVPMGQMEAMTERQRQKGGGKQPWCSPLNVFSASDAHDIPGEAESSPCWAGQLHPQLWRAQGKASQQQQQQQLVGGCELIGPWLLPEKPFPGWGAGTESGGCSRKEQLETAPSFLVPLCRLVQHISHQGCN